MPALATSPSSFPGWETLSPLQAACVGFDLLPRDDQTGPRSMAALARAWDRSESAMRDAKRRGYSRLRFAATSQGHDLDLIIAEYRRRQALAEANAA